MQLRESGVEYEDLLLMEADPRAYSLKSRLVLQSRLGHIGQNLAADSMVATRGLDTRGSFYPHLTLTWTLDTRSQQQERWQTLFRGMMTSGNPVFCFC